jgi:hypothetical protein
MSVFVRVKASRRLAQSSLCRIYEVFECEDGRWIVFNPDCTIEAEFTTSPDCDPVVSSCIKCAAILANQLGPAWMLETEELEEAEFNEIYKVMR